MMQSNLQPASPMAAARMEPRRMAQPIAACDYLLLARCGIDDVPLQLFKEAELAAVREAAAGWTRERILRIAGEVFRLDTSEIICLTIVRFARSRLPVEIETVEFHDAEDGEER